MAGSFFARSIFLPLHQLAIERGQKRTPLSIFLYLCFDAHPGSTSFCRFHLTWNKKHRTKSVQNASDVLLGSASDLVRCLVGFQSFTDPAPLARLEVFAYSTFKSCRAQNQSKTRVAITLRFASDFLRRLIDFQPLWVLLRLHDFQVVSVIQLCICPRTYVRIWYYHAGFCMSTTIFVFLANLLINQ